MKFIVYRVIKKICVLIPAISLLVFPIPILFAGGQEEAASSSGRGEYLAEQGSIIPESEIRISSYISGIDYSYPIPDKALSLTFVSGAVSLPKEPGAMLFQAGIQGEKGDFADLPPFNIAVVVDTSGSMAEADKLPLARKGLLRMVRRLRPKDRLALISAEDGAVSVVQSTTLNTGYRRERMIRAIEELSAEGKPSIGELTAEAYRQIDNHYDSRAINRLILLSDGNFSTPELLSAAASYRERGINLSTIGFGNDFNVEQMISLSKSGGGSSRFIGNTEDVEETFYSGFHRMTVPVARDLDMEFILHYPYTELTTWGYQHEIQGNRITYSLPTLHHSDYETIVVEAVLQPPSLAKNYKVAEFRLSYTDLSGKRITEAPRIIHLIYDPEIPEAQKLVSPYVLKSGTMLSFARTLIAIYRSYQHAADYREYLSREGNIDYNMVNRPRPDFPGLNIMKSEGNDAWRFNMEHALDLVLACRDRLRNAERRLGEPLFQDEQKILSFYVDIIGQQLVLNQEQIAAYNEGALRIPAEDNALEQETESFTSELLQNIPAGSGILFPGVILQGKGDSAAVQESVYTVLNNAGLKVMGAVADTVPRDYLDNTAALMAGKSSGAAYVLQVILVPGNGRHILYGKVLDSNSGKIVSSGQRSFAADRQSEETE